MTPQDLFRLTALSLSLMAGAAQAADIRPASYDMPNGHGQASGGSFNYWDKHYSGTGATTSDGAALSGGSGDLTDGVTASDNWNLVENAAGTGPYVGWQGMDPTITFHFDSTVRISGLVLYADDANGWGGVSTPAGVTIGGQRYDFTDPVGSAPLSMVVPGLDIVGKDVSLTLHRSNNWIFVSEIQFNAAPVPEAGSTALGAVGLLTAYALGRRKFKRPTLAPEQDRQA